MQSTSSPVATPTPRRDDLIRLLNRFAGTSEAADNARTDRGFIRATTANQELYDWRSEAVAAAFARSLVTEGEASFGSMREPVVRLTAFGREYVGLVARDNARMVA